MARTRATLRRRAHKRPGMTIPLAVVAGFGPLVYETIKATKANGFDGTSQALLAYTTGFSRWEGKWKAEYLMKGMGPVVAGLLVHKLAGRLGLNRALGKAGIPFVRV